MDYLVQVLAGLVTIGGIGLAIGIGYLAVRSLYRLGTNSANGKGSASLENQVNRLSERLDALEGRMDFAERLLSAHPRSPDI